MIQKIQLLFLHSTLSSRLPFLFCIAMNFEVLVHLFFQGDSCSIPSTRALYLKPKERIPSFPKSRTPPAVPPPPFSKFSIHVDRCCVVSSCLVVRLVWWSRRRRLGRCSACDPVISLRTTEVAFTSFNCNGDATRENLSIVCSSVAPWN